MDIDAGEASVELVRLSTTSSVLRAILESDLPREFADYLRAGGQSVTTVSER